MILKDKVAIVTGSSRGIGKAVALAFAREGATVIIAARTKMKSRFIAGTIYETADEIHALGGRAFPIRPHRAGAVDWAGQGGERSNCYLAKRNQR